MIYAAAAFSWISGIVIVAALMIPTTAVVNGVCISGLMGLSLMARNVYSIWDFLSFYVIILMIFIFCYGRILVTIRRQARVMMAHSRPNQISSAAQDHQSNKIQTSVIKTMILVCGLFALTWGPVYIYFLLPNFYPEITYHNHGLYPFLIVAYLYQCINPFIYATKFDPVKRVLLDLIPCKKNIRHDPQIADT